MIWSGALMLQFLGSNDAHDAILRAIEDCLKSGPRTPDLGGNARTTDIGRAIAEHVAGC
jgi:tartrate dehydrogenase/decarboxylase/D-malate dehydrogenase